MSQALWIPKNPIGRLFSHQRWKTHQTFVLTLLVCTYDKMAFIRAIVCWGLLTCCHEAASSCSHVSLSLRRAPFVWYLKSHCCYKLPISLNLLFWKSLTRSNQGKGLIFPVYRVTLICASICCLDFDFVCNSPSKREYGLKLASIWGRVCLRWCSKSRLLR